MTSALTASSSGQTSTNSIASLESDHEKGLVGRLKKATAMPPSLFEEYQAFLKVSLETVLSFCANLKSFDFTKEMDLDKISKTLATHCTLLNRVTVPDSFAVSSNLCELVKRLPKLEAITVTNWSSLRLKGLEGFRKDYCDGAQEFKLSKDENSETILLLFLKKR